MTNRLGHLWGTARSLKTFKAARSLVCEPKIGTCGYFDLGVTTPLFIDWDWSLSETRNLGEAVTKLYQLVNSKANVAKAIELIQTEAGQIPSITKVLRTQFGKEPTFVFLTSNKKYDPELDKRVIAIDRRLVQELPESFRFTLLCFPEMDKAATHFVSSEYEEIYTKEGLLDAIKG